MADLQFGKPVTYEAPKGMSLADMVNMASGVQQLRQAQQLNPLALQKAQLELEQVQKTMPLAVRKSAAEATTAETGSEKSALDLAQQKFQKIADSQISMINNPLVVAAEKDPKSVDIATLVKQVSDKADQTGKALGLPQEKINELKQDYINMAQTNPAGLRQFLKERHLQGLDAASRTSALNPSGTAVSFGSGGQTTATNEFGSVPVGQALPGTRYIQGLAPTVATSPTGAPMQFGGGAGGGGILNTNIAPRPALNNPNQSVVKPPVAAIQTAPAAAPAISNQFENKGGIQISPGETYDAYKARTGRLSALPAISNAEMNIGNANSIPQMEFTNDKIINLLEKKDVQVGKLAEAIANKTGGVGLNSDEVEIQKYLEQRIRQEGSRSNEDQESKRSAMGSFGTSKEALLDIIYNDKGTLAAKRLYHQGVLTHQGNPNQPNLASINNFENQFNAINNDPKVTQLIGIVGKKSLEELSPSAKQQVAKHFGKMSQNQIQDLFDKKQQLEDLAKGGK